MASIRFQILINGRAVCIAGVGAFGLLNAQIMRTRRTEKFFEEAQAKGPEYAGTLEEWMHEKLYIDVYAADWERDGHNASWLARGLKVGDEVTIRVLGPGEIDPPVNTIPPDADWH